MGDMMCSERDRRATRSRWGLVGPLRPFRGGIAQYTTMLHREFSREGRAMTISFRQFYPRWSYPGRSLHEPGEAIGGESGVSYSLNPYNPFSSKRVAQHFKAEGVEGVIVMWWTVFFAPSIGLLVRSLRRLEIPVCFLCHNVSDHETSWWKRLVAQIVLSGGTRFVVHSNQDAEELKALVPRASVVTHPHPVFSQFPEPRQMFTRSADLEILFFGFVRHYKGLDILAEAMKRLGDVSVHLAVVGEWWINDDKLKASLDELPNVDVVDKYVADDEVSEYFSRADVVVVPYRNATGSGVVSLAYHYGKAVIATRVGGLPDVVEDGVSGKLIDAEDPDALAQAIKWFLDVSPDQLSEGVKQVASRMTWESLASAITSSLGEKHR